MFQIACPGTWEPRLTNSHIAPLSMDGMGQATTCPQSFHASAVIRGYFPNVSDCMSRNLGTSAYKLRHCSFTNGWNGARNNLSAVIPCISSDLGSFSQCFRLWVPEPGKLGLQIETLLHYQWMEWVKQQPVRSDSMHQQ
jgi:hypothetical protein